MHKGFLKVRGAIGLQSTFEVHLTKTSMATFLKVVGDTGRVKITLVTYLGDQS